MLYKVKLNKKVVFGTENIHSFFKKLFTQQNAGRQKRLAKELKVLRRLPTQGEIG